LWTGLAMRFWLTFLLLAIGLNGTANSAPHRPNILFIFVDDLRAELGCYGAAHVKSPNIDGLAARGIIFDHAYCQYAQCAPSRSSLLTGLRPDQIGVYDINQNFRDVVPNVDTLPQHFKGNGYFTQGIGKVYPSHLDDQVSWSTPAVDPEDPYYVDPVLREKRLAAQAHAATVPGISDRERARMSYIQVAEAFDAPDAEYYDGVVTDMALNAMRRLKDQPQPFFLAVGFRKPHLPFVAPKRYWDLYEEGELSIASTESLPDGSPDYAVDSGEFRAFKDVPDGKLSADYQRHMRHAYYSCVSFIDDQVGKLIHELESLGIADETLIVFLGDHGYHLGEHGHWGKWTNYECDARAPLIISYPGQFKPGRRTGLVEFVDLYPTLVELVGLPMPAHRLEGRSFKTMLQDTDAPGLKMAFTQCLRHRPEGDVVGYSVRTEQYRYTQWLHYPAMDAVIAEELFDYYVDPDETTNLAEQSDRSGVKQRLRSVLASHRPNGASSENETAPD
jgi:iduronate 2-sulfatase